MSVVPSASARAAHAGGAMVVRGQRQRPVAEEAVVVVQQLRRGLGGAEGIHALIHRVVDAQEAPPGGAHELPQASRAHFRIGGGIERGFHMRQRRQFRRQAQVGEGLRNMRSPTARSVPAPRGSGRTGRAGSARPSRLPRSAPARPLRRRPARCAARHRSRSVRAIGQALEHLLDLAALLVHGIAPLAWAARRSRSVSVR